MPDRRASETIYALASAPGRAGVAVVRLSGPGAAAAIEALTGAPCPPPRHARLSTLSWQKDALDRALLLWFPAPHSFTGEDVAEFQIHGGRAVREGLFAALAALGLRPAEPGEFSRRAVENGRLDLTRAEAIADLVDAETQAQRHQALRQYDGALAALYDGWRSILIGALARAEAAIDFSDDAVGEEEFAGARAQAVDIINKMSHHLGGRQGEMLREGLRLAIIGPPNAGKSSLINALAGRDVAIVSDLAGTTRDVVDVRLDLGGFPVHIADTAGLRDPKDAIEAEGIRRALARAAQSDLVLLLRDGSQPSEDDDLELPAADLIVWNKSDLVWPAARDGLCVSLKTSEGLAQLIDILTVKVGDKLETSGAMPALTRHGIAMRWRRRSERFATVSPRRRSGPNFSPRICGWRCARSAGSPAMSMSRNCWIRCSRISASANNLV